MRAVFCVPFEALAFVGLLHPGPTLPPLDRASIEFAFGCAGTTAQDGVAAMNRHASHQDPPVKKRASGEFDVKLTPQAPDDYADGKIYGRAAIDKTFRGDLVGTSKGQMLTALTTVKGSAGYVAIEKVTGALEGRRGTFALQHTGTMARGAQRLTITVVPDSGTDDLTGIAGEMTIEIAGGKHSYVFEYTLPPRQ
jgi:Protein of unknown function (DUF3224)